MRGRLRARRCVVALGVLMTSVVGVGAQGAWTASDASSGSVATYGGFIPMTWWKGPFASYDACAVQKAIEEMFGGYPGVCWYFPAGSGYRPGYYLAEGPT